MKFSAQEYRRMEVITTNINLATPEEIKIINFCNRVFEIIRSAKQEHNDTYKELNEKDSLRRITKDKVLTRVNKECGDIFNTYREINDFENNFHLCHTMQYAYNIRHEICIAEDDRTNAAQNFFNFIKALAIFPPHVPVLNETSKECASHIATGLEKIFFRENYDFSRTFVDMTAEDCSKTYVNELKSNDKISKHRKRTEKQRKEQLCEHIGEVFSAAQEDYHSPSGEASKYFKNHKDELKKLGISSPKSFKNLILQAKKESNKQEQEENTSGELKREDAKGNYVREARRLANPFEELKFTIELQNMLEQLDNISNDDGYKFSLQPRSTRFPHVNPNDVLLSCNGEPVFSVQKYKETIASLKPPHK
jgi:hypothetical protein